MKTKRNNDYIIHSFIADIYIAHFQVGLPGLARFKSNDLNH